MTYGMKVPIDGICLAADQLSMDESAMTGESDECRKDTIDVVMKRFEEKKSEKTNKDAVDSKDLHDLPSPVILSGTSVAGGEGRMVGIVVGDISCLGIILSKMKVRPETTPLQHKLEKIAGDIGLLGTYCALLTIHVLLLRFLIEGFYARSINVFTRGAPTVVGEAGESHILAYLKAFVEYIIIGVAIIVVAVPEGLPLAVMISLAFSIKSMLKDNNDVKRLASCEIMGGANNICSDKTGTLTLNMMKVTKIWSGKSVVIPQTMIDQGDMSKMTPIVWADFFGKNTATPRNIELNISCNTAEQTGATDRAMVELLERAGTDM